MHSAVWNIAVQSLPYVLKLSQDGYSGLSSQQPTPVFQSSCSNVFPFNDHPRAVSSHWESRVFSNPESVTLARLGVNEWKLLSRVWLFVTPWTTQSMESSRPEHWSGQPFPSAGDLPSPGMEPGVSCIAGGFFTRDLLSCWPWRETLGLSFPHPSMHPQRLSSVC